MNSHQKNKSLAVSFYTEVIGPRNSERAKSLIAENYIQHNPTLPDGRAGVLMAIEFLKKLPVPETPKNPIRRIIAEKDLVVLHLDIEFGGSKKAVIDIFRIENDQLAEHWDVVQDQPIQTQNGHLMVDGHTEIEDAELTEPNKNLVERFFENVLINRNLGQIPLFLGESLIQHHPDIKNEAVGFGAYLKEKTGQLLFEKPARMIAEGNFVVSHSRMTLNDKPYALCFIFRLKNHKIVELWSVSQEIPAQMPHGNGMV